MRSSRARSSTCMASRMAPSIRRSRSVGVISPRSARSRKIVQMCWSAASTVSTVITVPTSTPGIPPGMPGRSWALVLTVGLPPHYPMKDQLPHAVRASQKPPRGTRSTSPAGRCDHIAWIWWERAGAGWKERRAFVSGRRSSTPSSSPRSATSAGGRCGRGRSAPGGCTTRPPSKPTPSTTCSNSSRMGRPRWTPATGGGAATILIRSASRPTSPARTRPPKRPRPGSRPATPSPRPRSASSTPPPAPSTGPPAALDRPSQEPARNHPGDRLAGARPRRHLVTRRCNPITKKPRGRTPKA
jgi:hypothetical protein